MQTGFRRDIFVTSFRAFHTQVIEQTLVELVENTIKFLTTQYVKCRRSNAQSCIIRRAVCETYPDSDKRDPHEFMNGQTTVVSRLAGRCLLELQAIDTGRISDNTKTTRSGDQAVNARCTNEMKRERIFFLSLPVPFVAMRAIITDPPRRDNSAELEHARQTEHARI